MTTDEQKKYLMADKKHQELNNDKGDKYDSDLDRTMY